MEGGKDRYHHEEIKKQCDIGDEAGRPVVDDHEGNDEDESQQDRPGGHCHRIRAERRSDTLLRYDREVDRKRCGTQGDRAMTVPAAVALLRGQYAQVFGTEYRNARPGPADAEGSLAYLLEGRPGGLLCLDAQGRPVRWQEKEGREHGWIMDIDYDDAALPRRLKLSHDNGKRAIVLIKDRETPAAPFSADAMRLDLPADTRILPLEKFRRIDD